MITNFPQHGIQFLAEVGGLMAFFLGISVISVIECLCYCTKQAGSGNNEESSSRNLAPIFLFILVQGDTSRCFQPPVDMKTKVAFHYEAHVLKHKFCFHVNGKSETTSCVALYKDDQRDGS